MWVIRDSRCPGYAHPGRRHPNHRLLFSAKPLNEPITIGGPFVMNTKTEITKAFNDFHSGKFGQIPRQARLTTR